MHSFGHSSAEHRQKRGACSLAQVLGSAACDCYQGRLVKGLCWGHQDSRLQCSFWCFGRRSRHLGLNPRSQRSFNCLHLRLSWTKTLVHHCRPQSIKGNHHHWLYALLLVRDHHCRAQTTHQKLLQRMAQDWPLHNILQSVEVRRNRLGVGTVCQQCNRRKGDHCPCLISISKLIIISSYNTIIDRA